MIVIARMSLSFGFGGGRGDWKEGGGDWRRVSSVFHTD